MWPNPHWSYLLKKSLIGKFIFHAMYYWKNSSYWQIPKTFLPKKNYRKSENFQWQLHYRKFQKELIKYIVKICYFVKNKYTL